MLKTNNFIFIKNYFFQSKYIFNSLHYYPKILTLSFNTIIYYKKKNKIFLFIKIIYLLFFTSTLKTSFLLKNQNINILSVKLRNNSTIIPFLFNFVYIYLPLIDSFSTELKYIIKKQIFTFCFFKFPLLFELNVLFFAIEYLLIFMGSFKFQLQLFLKKQKNNSMNYNLFQFIKLPLLIS